MSFISNCLSKLVVKFITYYLIDFMKVTNFVVDFIKSIADLKSSLLFEVIDSRL